MCKALGEAAEGAGGVRESSECAGVWRGGGNPCRGRTAGARF